MSVTWEPKDLLAYGKKFGAGGGVEGHAKLEGEGTTSGSEGQASMFATGPNRVGTGKPSESGVSTRGEIPAYDNKRTVSRNQARPARTSYNPQVVLAWFRECGLPEPVPEFRFHTERKWRFDWAWVEQGVALEVQGSIFTQGRHTRGAALLKEWEKLNEAAAAGWRVLYCQPADLCTTATADVIRRAIIHTAPNTVAANQPEPVPIHGAGQRPGQPALAATETAPDAGS